MNLTATIRTIVKTPPPLKRGGWESPNDLPPDRFNAIREKLGIPEGVNQFLILDGPYGTGLFLQQAMNPTPDQIRGIYDGIESIPVTFDTQGWNSSNPIFSRLITQIKPSTIIEVGVWKGASLIHMADICRELNLPTILYGVDAWFGHVGDMIGNAPLQVIPHHWTNPTLYQQFLFNVKASSHEERIVPVWQLTRWGALCLTGWEVVADLIYLDAGHDEHEAYADMRNYWPLLREGGVMFGDDYSEPYGVKPAAERFAKEVGRSLHVERCQWFLDPK